MAENQNANEIAAVESEDENTVGPIPASDPLLCEDRYIHRDVAANVDQFLIPGNVRGQLAMVRHVVEPIAISNDVNRMERHSFQSDADSRKRKRTSAIWDHFVAQGNGKCTCKHCGKIIVGGGRSGTHGLHGHCKSCPVLNSKKPKGSGFGFDSVNVGDYLYDEQKSRKILAEMIIGHEYPLSMVEHEGFQEFCASLQPSFRVKSQNTVKSDILKIYEHEKERIVTYLGANSSRIAITADMWMSNNQKRGFMRVTAHLINDAWVLENRLVRLIYVPFPHTADVLGTALMNCLTEWNIVEKLSALTVDNRSPNDAMTDDLLERISTSSQLLGRDLFHMRCFAHILNLIVRDGLEMITGSIEKIRGCVAYWSATPKREEKFIEMAKTMNSNNPTKLILDCQTRWSSTYLMLQSALKNKDVFLYLQHDYKTIPTEEEWGLTRVITEKLQIFYNNTLLFSGSKYPTANLYFPNLCNIKIGIRKWLTSDHIEVRMMAHRMSLKFDKYWNSVHGMLAIATILDPRFKIELIEFYFSMIYEDDTSEVARIKLLISNFTNHYLLRLKATQVSSQSSVSPSFLPFDSEDESLASFDSYVSSKRKKDSLKSELDDYLAEKLVPRNNTDFDILEWWKVRGIRYPTLQAMARDVLAIPISSVDSESTFTAGGRVMDAHSNRLPADILEALVCTRDWKFNEMRGGAGIKSKDVWTFDTDLDVSESMKENSSLYD